MNWKLCGVIYPPYCRAYDRKREGNASWRLRMSLAAFNGLLMDNNGGRIGHAEFLVETS